MKTELLAELASHLKWDPATEEYEINRTKINHIFKRHFQDTKYQHEFESKTGDTLYKALATHSLGNLMLYAGDKITADRLLELTGKGLNSLGKYPYAYDDAERFVNELREIQAKVWEIYSIGVSDFGMTKCKLEVPPVGEAKALNTILSSVSLPPIQELIKLAGDNATRIKEAQKTAKEAEKVSSDLKVDMERLQEELRNMALKADTQVQSFTIEEHDGTIPGGKTTMKKASEIFDVTLSQDFEVPVFEWDGIHPDVPLVDENYIFRPKELLRVLYAIVTNQRAYLQGHTGTGKTTLIEQIAARLNFPFIRVNFDSEITRMDLIGRDTLSTDEEGNTISKFVDGILPKAMASPCFLCCDEIDFVRPDVAYVMQAALEGNGLRITEDGDRVVKPNPMFRMFATGNTVGQGDEHGMYQGARPQSLALLDRFTIWINVDYLNKEQREGLVKMHQPGLSADDQRALSKYMDEHLEAFTTGKVMQPISPRGMLAIAKAAVLIGSLKEALGMSVLDRASSDDRAVLKGLIDRVT